MKEQVHIIRLVCKCWGNRNKPEFRLVRQFMMCPVDQTVYFSIIPISYKRDLSICSPYLTSSARHLYYGV